MARWTIGPLAAFSALLLPVLQADATGSRLVVAVLLETLFVCAALLMLSPTRFAWAGRVVGALLALGYTYYLVDMIVERPMSFWPPSSRSVMSVLIAVLGFFILGYPGLKYALVGRFTWRGEESRG